MNNVKDFRRVMSSLKGSLIIAICFAVSFSALKAQDTKAVEPAPSSKATEFQKKMVHYYKNNIMILVV